MKIVDLSSHIYSGLSFYPGDPKISVELISTIERDGWNLRQIKMTSHDSTHVNVPIHSKIGGKDLDCYEIENFMGSSILYESLNDIQKGKGVIFGDTNIDFTIAKKVVEIGPKFIGLSDKFEFDIAVEKYLLDNDVISFERLANTEKLPKFFVFYGIPMKIKKGDGSPVRAYAIIS